MEPSARPKEPRDGPRDVLNSRGGRSWDNVSKKVERKPRSLGHHHATAGTAPAERVAAIWPMWQQMTEDERTKLLTVKLDALRHRARALDEQSAASRPAHSSVRAENSWEPYAQMSFTLLHALDRLRCNGSVKTWCFSGHTSLNTASFKDHVHQHLIPSALQHLLPKGGWLHTESKNTEAVKFCERMHQLASSACTQQTMPMMPNSSLEQSKKQKQYLRKAAAVGAFEPTINSINNILAALSQEHEVLHQSILKPITTFVTDTLPAKACQTTAESLHVVDLQKLPPEAIKYLQAWLLDKVATLASQSPHNQGGSLVEYGILSVRDVECLIMADNGTGLAPHPQLVKRLQHCVVMDDHLPHQATKGQNADRQLASLEWVYGTIRPLVDDWLGMRQLTAEEALSHLIQALEQQADWEVQVQQDKQLLQDMLESRREYQQLLQQYKFPDWFEHSALAPAPGAAHNRAKVAVPQAACLPDEVVMKLLRRELLLTRGRLQTLMYESMKLNRELHRTKAQALTAKIQLSQWKRRLGLSKSMHHLAASPIADVEGTAVEQCRGLVDDLTSKVQLLQETCSSMDGMTHVWLCWDMEIEQLHSQYQDIMQLPTDATLLEPLQLHSHICVMMDGKGLSTKAQQTEPNQAAPASDEQAQTLHDDAKLRIRAHFHDDFLKRLCTESDDRSLFGRIMSKMKDTMACIERGKIALQFLEQAFMDAACDDPGPVIARLLMRPLVQQQIDSAAAAYQQQRSDMSAETAVAAVAAAADKLKQALSAGAAGSIAAAWERLDAAAVIVVRVVADAGHSGTTSSVTAQAFQQLMRCIMFVLGLPPTAECCAAGRELISAMMQLHGGVQKRQLAIWGAGIGSYQLGQMTAAMTAAANRLHLEAAEADSAYTADNTVLNALDSLLSYSKCLLLLFATVTSWPLDISESGLVCGPLMLAAAVAAAELIAAVLGSAPLAVSTDKDATQHLVPATLLVESAKIVIWAVSTYGNQSFRVPPCISRLSLLLLELQLQQRQQGTAGDTGTLSSHCCSSSSGHRAATDVDVAAAAAPTAGAALKHKQQFRQQVLQLYGRTEQYWQQGYTAALDQESDLVSTLSVLTQQLQQMSQHHQQLDEAADAVLGPQYASVCSLLPSLVLVLLQSSVDSYVADSSSRQAWSALYTAAAAAEAWLSSVQGSNRSELAEAEVDPGGAQAIELMQLVNCSLERLLHTAVTNSSSKSSCSSELRKMLMQLLDIADVAQRVSAALSSCGLGYCSSAASKHIQPALAAAEHCVRLAATAAQHLTLTHSLQSAACKLLNSAGNRLYQLDSGTVPTATMAAMQRQHVALALSCAKISMHEGWLHWKPLAAVSGMAVQQLQMQGEQQQLSAATPWLLLQAKCCARGGGEVLDLLQRVQRVELESPAAAAAGLIEQEHREAQLKALLGNSLSTFTGNVVQSVVSMFSGLQQLVGTMKAAIIETASNSEEPTAASEAQHKQQQLLLQPESAGAATLPAVAAALVQPQLAELLQLFEDQIMPAATMLHEMLVAAKNPVVQVQLVAESKTFGMPLLKQMMDACKQLCALLPLPLCCNNPGCGNVSMQSELQLVGGKACVCAGCEVARYCGRECQAAHWQAHRKVCKMIKKSLRAGAMASNDERL